MGLTSAFYIAQRGLQISQLAMEVVSHNVANVNTAGYSRQQVNLVNGLPATSRYGPLGTGVDAFNIGRVHDKFIQRNLTEKSALYAKFAAQKTSMDAIESVFNESIGNGINESLSDFWNAWQDVANNPEGNPERVNLLEKADTLAKTINVIRRDLDDIRSDINRRIEEAVIQANALIKEIASLNEKIVSMESGFGHQANDLRDQRDEYIKQLSEYMDITYFEDSRNGAVSVLTTKGTPLVADGTSWSIDANVDETTGDIRVDWIRTNGGRVDITENITSGMIGGWLELREDKLNSFYVQFEAFTESLITEVNRQAAQGAGLANFTDLISSYDLSDFACYKTKLAGNDNDLKFTSLIEGVNGQKIGIKYITASSPSQQLSVDTTYVPGASPPATETYNITVTLPINSAGQVTATAADVAQLINSQKTPGLSTPPPFPPAGPPYLAGDLVKVELAHGELGRGIVAAMNDPADPAGYVRLNNNLENVLVFGDEIKYAFDYARCQTNLDGDNNDIIFTALGKGANGEAISIEYVDAVAGNVNPVITVTGNRIQIDLSSTGGFIDTTANDLINYINNSSDPGAVAARALVTVQRAPDSTGGGTLAVTSSPQFLDRSGSFDLVSYDPDGVATIHTITVRPTDDKWDVIDQINAIANISAGEHKDTGNNYIRIQADAGYTFAFGHDTANALMALGLNTFFSGYSASTIKLNSVITDDVRLMAAGQIDVNGLIQTGDNTNALLMADLKDQKFLIGNKKATISEAYNTLSSDVGAVSHTVTRNHDFNMALVDQLYTQRDMVSAVNLDEEMADLLKFQYMYQASAKMIAVADEMLQTLLAIK
jgi:flagellar hook-associated protein FlgK